MKTNKLYIKIASSLIGIAIVAISVANALTDYGLAQNLDLHPIVLASGSSGSGTGTGSGTIPTGLPTIDGSNFKCFHMTSNYISFPDVGTAANVIIVNPRICSRRTVTYIYAVGGDFIYWQAQTYTCAEDSGCDCTIGGSVAIITQNW